MEINCGSVGLITLQQSRLMCAGGEARLAALLLVILVKAQLLSLTKECMKLLTYHPKIRGDNCASFPNNAVDANDNDDEDEEGKEGEEDENENEDEDEGEGEDKNPSGNKGDPVKGHNRATAGRGQENGEDEDDEQGDANEDEDDDDDDDEEEDDDEDDEDGSEEVVGEEEDEEEEEEEIQPPKKRKK